MTAAAPPFLPYGRQSVDEEDIAAVAAVLRGDWLTQGPAVAAFERALADRVGAREAVACANGTAALRLAYAVLDLGPGDAVVVPANTFLATASAARHAGAEVAFADVDPATGLMGAEQAEAAVARGR
ncbi:aminotransferase class I/II-fold pyridoxal phosphate-dependent enzyme, partial [Azospirillum doebereinerae]|nr:aminotransferase class I/II-fold pyridoxal phosphate-dependent enzyme [Azospirillum doebereinerae]